MPPNQQHQSTEGSALQFSDVHDGGPPVSWIIKNLELLTADGWHAPKCVTVLISIKVAQNCSKDWFSRWQKTAILICLNPEILLASGVWMAKMNHFAKLNKNWSYICSDIVVFWFSRWQLAVVLDKSGNLNGLQHPGSQIHYHAKFRQNQSCYCEDITIFSFFNIAAGETQGHGAMAYTTYRRKVTLKYLVL